MRRLHTHYENLKVARNAPTEVIRAAYRILAQKYHPDVNPTQDAARIMQMLNEAWAVLGDPVRRAEHDTWIAEQEAAAGRSSATGATTQGHRHTDRDSGAGAPGPAADQSNGRPGFTARTTSRLRPLVRLNAWLGAADGKVVAGSMALIAAFVVWLANRSSELPRSLPPVRPSASTRALESVPPPTEVAQSQSPANRNAFDPTTAIVDRTREAVRSPRAAVPEKARGFTEFTGVLDQDARPQPLAERVRWSPNGRPWPRSAGYISGMRVGATGGLSKLTIDNSNGASDVYVKLCAFGRERCNGYRHLFIPKGASFTMNGITSATYDVRYRDLSSGYIAKSEAMSLTQTEESGGVRYSVITLTLYRVQGGNTNFTPLSEEQF